MAILQVVQHRLTSIFILSLFATLVACGGGGSKSDTTPNNFTFSPVIGAATGEVVTSNTITVAGMNKPAPISINGGQYSINGGAFTASAGTVTQNQTIRVQVTSSSSTNTAVTATINIGGVSSAFTVTTFADVTPDSFTFPPVIDATPSEVYVSNSVTVTGIDVAVPITVTGGEYSVNGGAYTSAAGTVTVNQTVTVRVTASAELETAVTAAVTIGGVMGAYTVTTFADTTPPTAEFLFPPKVSMTEGTTLRVRGKITDDYNEVASAQIQVNGTAAQTLTLTMNDDGSANWDQVVTLAAGENTIRIIATDDLDNTTVSGEEVFVNVRHDVTLGSFPDAVNPIPVPRAVVIDRLNGRNRLLVGGDAPSNETIRTVDLNTGARGIFTNFSGVTFTNIQDMLLLEDTEQIAVRDDGSRIAILDLEDPTQVITNGFTSSVLGGGFAFTLNDTDPNNLILMAGNGQNGDLVSVSLDLSSTEIFSDNSNLEQGAAVPIEARGIAFDKTNQRYLLAISEDQTVYAIDSEGVRSVFSNNSVGLGDNFAEPGNNMFIRGITVDEVGQRVLLLERNSGKVFFINNETKDRTLLSSPTIPNTMNPMGRLSGLAVNSFDSYVFVSDELAVGIFAVDLVTGERVYFSKN